ncbi:C-X-C motif chemokine 6 [Trichomycterus rosablanca]|uniref:C-X-C motif chemokine 6 n=1 Tax=Trichomycterus rosablanca TaxID=2290929 RepID=UPI002F35BE34
MSRPVLLLLLVCLVCVSCSSAFRMDRLERCLCRRVYRVNPQNIAGYKVHRPSSSCNATEIVVYLNNGRKVCLDPKQKAWTYILQKETAF